MQSTKTKSLAVLALASMFLMAFAMTAFWGRGGDRRVRPRPVFYLLGAGAAGGSHRTGADHKGGLQLPVYRDRRRGDPVFRREL